MNSIADMTRAAGVVGAGGAGFPAYVKLMGRADTVIANGAECEPLMVGDTRLIETRAFEVIEGLRLSMSAVGAGRGVVAIKAKNERALSAVETVLAAVPEDITLHLLGDFYPAGDEFVLVEEVTGRQVPEMGIPLTKGVVVHNVNSLFWIYLASLGKSVLTRRLTVVGEVARPSVMTVPVGAPLSMVIEAAGGLTTDDPVLIAGGPMMGPLAKAPTDPVTKTTTGLLVLEKSHPLARARTLPFSQKVARSRAACDECRRCTDFCPRFRLGHDLRPDAILRAVTHGPSGAEFDSLYRTAWLCSGCNLCEFYACPLNLFPASINVALKDEMARGGVRYQPRARALEVKADLPRIPMSALIRRLGLDGYARIPVEDIERTIEVDRVRLRLSQHLGAPAGPVVRLGDEVREGDVVGEAPRGAIGARIHASISGVVSAVTTEYVEVSA